MIHELKQVLWVITPHGIGQALFLMDYGIHQNTIWVVALKDTKEIKHYSSEMVRITINHTID
tara:strand:- start:220 stop:405 length:186 start_codon:yes stop_codon:yes gene_type:complete